MGVYPCPVAEKYWDIRWTEASIQLSCNVVSVRGIVGVAAMLLADVILSLVVIVSLLARLRLNRWWH